MKRIWVPVVVFLSLGIICWAGLSTTQWVTKEMEFTLSAAITAAEEENNELAVTLSEKAMNDWHIYHKKLCIFMPHARLESIEQNLATLAPLIRNDSKEQFLAECERCSTQINYLSETEIPTLENLF